VLARLRLSLTASVPTSPVYPTRWTQDVATEDVSHDLSGKAISGKSQGDQWQRRLLEWCYPNGKGMPACNWHDQQSAVQDFHILAWSTTVYMSAASKSLHGPMTFKQLFFGRSQIVVSAKWHWASSVLGIEHHHSDVVAIVLPLATVSHSLGQRAVANCPGLVKMCQAPVAALSTSMGCSAWMLLRSAIWHMCLPLTVMWRINRPRCCAQLLLSQSTNSK